MSKNHESADRRITRAAGIVMIGFALSSLSGLASQVLITNAFGTGARLDAFYTANRLPETLFNLIAGGALASAFLPTLTGFLARNDRKGSWRLTSSVVNLILIILGVLSVTAAVAAPWLVRTILAPGYKDAEQIRLTVSLLRIMLLSPAIFGLSGILMATLNAHQHFALPALAPACYRLGLIFGVLFLVPPLGIFGLAWGTVLGALLHLFVQLPALRMLKPSYQRTLGLEMPAVREVGRLMMPRLLGVAVVQLNFWVNTILASGQPEGSLSALTFAFQLMLMPQAVIAQATAIAALPTFSEQFARGKIEELRRSFSNTLRGVLFLALPASMGLILLRKPIVTLLFERGAFGAQSTEQVSWALLWWGVGLVGHSVLEIIVRAFYAMHDTRTPVAVGAVMMGLNVLFSLAFSALFERIGWMPHGGLALANSLATTLECTALLWLLHRRLGGLDLARTGHGMLNTVGASLGMSLVLWVWLALTGGRSTWLIGIGGALVGFGVYWLMSLALGSPETRQLPGFLIDRSR
ncbi:MAG: murein biosynthesis integral membrane protein MurJ [Anaerolineales bacterium]|jgi:putative peptidoglycan lipid II flippase